MLTWIPGSCSSVVCTPGPAVILQAVLSAWICRRLLTHRRHFPAGHYPLFRLASLVESASAGTGLFDMASAFIHRGFKEETQASAKCPVQGCRRASSGS